LHDVEFRGQGQNPKAEAKISVTEGFNIISCYYQLVNELPNLFQYVTDAKEY